MTTQITPAILCFAIATLVLIVAEDLQCRGVASGMANEPAAEPPLAATVVPPGSSGGRGGGATAGRGRGRGRGSFVAQAATAADPVARAVPVEQMAWSADGAVVTAAAGRTAVMATIAEEEKAMAVAAANDGATEVGDRSVETRTEGGCRTVSVDAAHVSSAGTITATAFTPAGDVAVAAYEGVDWLRGKGGGTTAQRNGDARDLAERPRLAPEKLARGAGECRRANGPARK